MNNWIKTNDYYNRDVVKCDVYSRVISKKRTIYIMDSKDKNFTYTFSFGASSVLSFSVSFYKTNVNTLSDAMDYLDKFCPLWINNDFEGLQELKETINKP